MSNAQTDTLTIAEAAQLLRVTPLTLANWRKAGTGPPWIRLGPRTVRYRHASLVAYLDKLEGKTAQKRPEPQSPKRGRPTNRARAVKAAVRKLDPESPAHWVGGWQRKGQPKLTAVRRLVGSNDITYADIDQACPGWTRDKAAAASKSRGAE